MVIKLYDIKYVVKNNYCIYKSGIFMPKLKTKSSAKKRFRFTASGKIKMPQAGKRHGMIKRTNSQIRKQRGTTIMTKQDSKIVKSYMPYNLRG